MQKRTRRTENKTIVVGDTSALISLAVGQVLKPCLELSDIIIPKKVHFELKEMALGGNVSNVDQENSV